MFDRIETPDEAEYVIANDQRNGLGYREDWLWLVARQLTRHFEFCADETIPSNIRLSCGFPSRAATARKNQRIGECWDSGTSEDQTFEIFVSPVLADALEVAAVLAHELVHATVGLAAKHGGAFKRLALAIGLEGKMTSTVPGEKFKAWFAAQDFPPYPHAKLNASSAPKKQGTRMVKCVCPECEAEGEPYIVRMSASTAERGMPLCPLHDVPLVC